MNDEIKINISPTSGSAIGSTAGSEFLMPASSVVVAELMQIPNSPSQSQKEYIRQVLIGEIGDVVNHHKWLSFGLITAGIEFLGKCLDVADLDMHKEGFSGRDFRKAVDQLFPAEYKQYNDLENTKTFTYDLYTELRCGLNHSTLPKAKIALSERVHHKQLYISVDKSLSAEIYAKKHLTVNGGVLILIAEDFFEDFKNACESVIKKLESGEINEKFYVKLV